MALVSIYIPSRNYGKYLRDCLTSVKKQLFRDFELFLIDEGSTDNTFQEFNIFKEQEQDIKTTLIQNSKPLGLQKLANNILARATSQFILRLDADDMLTETALLSLVEKAKLAHNEHNVFVTGDYFVSDNLGKITGHQTHKDNDQEGDLFNELAPHGACALVSVRLMKAIGGYNTEFRAQDGWDIWTKIQNRCEHLHVSSPIFIYRQHLSSMSQTRQKILDERRKIIESRSAIKKHGYVPSIKFLIAAKSVYHGQQRVPLITLGEETLVQRCIRSLDDTGFDYKAYYVTDDDKVEDYFTKVYPAVKPLKIDKDTCSRLFEQDAPPINEYLYHLSQKDEYGNLSDICAFINLHSIGRTGNHLVSAVNQLTNSTADILYSVERVRDILFEGDANRMSPFYYGRYNAFSGADSYMLSFNGAFVMAWSDAVNKNLDWDDRKSITGFEMTSIESVRYTSDLASRVNLDKLRIRD